MKQAQLHLLLLLAWCVWGPSNLNALDDTLKRDERIFVFGGDINLKFVEYIIGLTNKPNPRICYLPTASADNQDNIKRWENICKALGIEPVTLKVWVSSSEKNQSFEDILLSSDAIVVGGGNTLNMLGIWKAQGIDAILKRALKQGVVLAGGSAGSICWFQNGISDSRPVNLSVVDGLGILPYSNCPHYSQETKKKLYHRTIEEGEMSAGYASDELAGVLFENGKAVEFVSQSDNHNSYFVGIENGKLASVKMESRILLRKNALSQGSYTSLPVQKRVSDLLGANDRVTPLNAYVSEVKALSFNKDNISESERNRALNIGIPRIFIYKNTIAGVVNDKYVDDFGYGLWYFYNCNGAWTSTGEDIGGRTVFESEITFREKAEIIMKRAVEKLNCH